MNLDEEAVAAERTRIEAEIRAHRLAELRKRQHVTQTELAGRMHVAQTRVSAIERGEVDAAEVSTLRRYVAALGGNLEIVANFGDEKLVIG
jgi:transcriptional regulator with XRE-family HTH domain